MDRSDIILVERKEEEKQIQQLTILLMPMMSRELQYYNFSLRVTAKRNAVNFYFCWPGCDRAPYFRAGGGRGKGEVGERGWGEGEGGGYLKKIFTANNK